MCSLFTSEVRMLIVHSFISDEWNLPSTEIKTSYAKHNQMNLIDAPAVFILLLNQNIERVVMSLR